jgi:hypothetical protein
MKYQNSRKKCWNRLTNNVRLTTGGSYIIDAEIFHDVKYDFLSTLPEKEEINWDIDVRYENDVLKAFDKFIEKWCGKNSAHLLDNDEQDGEFMRDKIRELIKPSPSLDGLEGLQEINEIDLNSLSDKESLLFGAKIDLLIRNQNIIIKKLKSL